VKRISILNGVVIAGVMFFAFRGTAQTNSWTKPTSGFWHESFWSLGVLPDASQSHIFFTNAGWKALAVDNVTARDFPDSLNIPRLTVASPTNTMNTLLLNFAGIQSPLRVAESFELGSNSVLLTLSSALEVGDDFFVDGTVSHGDLSQVSASSVYVGNTSPGVYNFSNGLVSAGNVIVGDGTAGSFHQSGGQLSLSGQLRLGRGDPFTFATGDGRFELTAGTLTAPKIQIGEARGRLGPPGADGTFVQSGGSNFAGRLLLGWPDSDTSSFGDYIYILKDGLLTTSNTVVYGGSGDFAQFGGVHEIDGPLALAGFYGRSFTPFTAYYTLSGGVVTARSLNIDFGTMSQSAGTNQISGDVVVGLKEAFSRHAFYNLSGGTLGTSNTLLIDSAKGRFSQNGGTHAVRNLLEIAGPAPQGFGPGYTLSAGELIAGNVRVSTNGTFTQAGGAANATVIDIIQGEFNLTSGDLVAGTVYVGDGAEGTFLLNAGRLVVTNRLHLGLPESRYDIEGHGQFRLTGGTLIAPTIQLGTAGGFPGDTGGAGTVIQSGGSNLVGALRVGATDSTSYRDSTYSLVDGVLNSSNSVVNPESAFFQSGGLHLVEGPLTVRGTLDRYSTVGSDYYLSNGTVRSRSLTVGPVAAVFQYDGTNEVDGDLVVGGDLFLGGSRYNLAGGALRTGNTIVEGSLYNDISQTGGVHNITGTLDLKRPITYYSSQNPVAVRYALDGGELRVRDIRVSTNAVFGHGGGTLSHSGTLTLEGGTWQSAPVEQQLGGLKLAAPNVDSSLLLPDFPAALRFANSAVIPWDAVAVLVIKNWRGSTNGGGSHRIVFGTNETGLTSQQLAQTRFRDPAGLPTGDYSATILNTGEIVPLQPTGRNPSIVFRQSSGELQLTWPVDYTLQTSTNVLGPFEDLDMTSPKTFGTTFDPQRFFRLRKSEAQ
jgi:hypothetical protein